MINFFKNIEIDRISFWLGFIAGALFFLMINIARKFLPGVIKTTRRQLQETREKLTASVETRLRNDVIRQAQKQHLASQFFALDEIALEPRLIAPPPLLTVHKTSPAVDVVHLTIPYAPDWPELAATYRAPTISLVESLSEQANLVLLGHPGSGKTFALAWLASRIARKDPLVGPLGEYLPVYFHAAEIPVPATISKAIENVEPQPEHQPDEQLPVDIKQPEDKPEKTKTSLERLVSLIGKYASPLTLPRLPSLLLTCLTDKRAIIIIDGLDELHPERLKQAVDFLAMINTDFPGNRMITSGSFEYLDGLIGLGLYPVALSAWGEEYKEKLVNKWSHQWKRLILPHYPPTTAPSIDMEFLNNWLLTKETPSNPFELTLKIWGAYAGDLTGIDQPSLIESYLRRTTVGVEGARQALEQLAIQMISNQSLKAHQQEANQWISSQSQNLPTEAGSSETILESDGAGELPHLRGRVSLNSLTNGGILIPLPDSNLGFPHPLFTGYLAGSRLSASTELTTLQDQPNWTGKAIALYFMAFFGDASFLAMSFIRRDDILNNELLRVARWLRITPRNRAWRSLVLRALASALNKEAATLTLGVKLITAIALSGDQGVAVLFRQLLKSDKLNLRQLAALGCGLIKDTKAIADLSELIEDRNPSLARSACLALVEIGDKSALETVASELMHGSEASRKAAAEALANHPIEGHPALEEGSNMDDLMVRRSVVFGLARIKKPWASQILDKLQMEDKEWVVRNAAIQVIEEAHQPNPHVPHPFPAYNEIGWLSEFANKQGLGVTDKEQALDLVFRAMKSGTEDERLAAIEFLGMNAGVETAASVYPLYFGQAGDLHEAAYQALWQMSITGVSLPPPE